MSSEYYNAMLAPRTRRPAVGLRSHSAAAILLVVLLLPVASLAGPGGVDEIQNESTASACRTETTATAACGMSWLATYEGPNGPWPGCWGACFGREIPTGIASDVAGTRVYVAGLVYAHATDYGTVAYDATTGERLWASLFDSGTDSHDHLHAVAVSPDGRTVYVTGDAGWGIGSSTSDFVTVAYDAETGAELWVARHDGPGGHVDVGIDVTVSPDSTRVYVTGSSSTKTRDLDITTIAYDAAEGTPVWITYYDGPRASDDQATGIATSPDGQTVYVGGTSRDHDWFSDPVAIAYDAATGTKRWIARHDAHRAGDATAQSMAISADGKTMFLAGTSQAAFADASRDVLVLAVDTQAGHVLWHTDHDGAAGLEDRAKAISVVPDGGHVYLTGFTTNAQKDLDILTLGLDATTGNISWTVQEDGAGGHDGGNAVIASPDGAIVYIAAERQHTRDRSDVEDAQEWIERLVDELTGIGGHPRIATTSDHTIIAYDAKTGAQLWLGLHAGTGVGPNRARVITVSPDGGHVYVAGAIETHGTGQDFLTIAYSRDGPPSG